MNLKEMFSCLPGCKRFRTCPICNKKVSGKKEVMEAFFSKENDIEFLNCQECIEILEKKQDKIIRCHSCEKKIPTRLNYTKEPTYYIKMVQKDKDDCLYWCNRECFDKKGEVVSIDIA